MTKFPQNTLFASGILMIQNFDILILGAGAAGLFCASQAGQHGKKIALLDHGAKAGEKIRISGGGRCNFTNLYTKPQNYISQNPHFCISALNQFSAHDFIKLVEKHQIAYHEKTLGQLFCDQSAQQIIDMLLSECQRSQVFLGLSTKILSVQKQEQHYIVTTDKGLFSATSVIVATGGKSIPKMGATGLGYQIAQQFGHNIIETRAGLVPFTYQQGQLDIMKKLSGTALPHTRTSFQKQAFQEALLFTHKGLSGPAILQISSYWHSAQPLSINFLPNLSILDLLKQAKQETPKQILTNFFHRFFSKKMSTSLCLLLGLPEQYGSMRLADLSNKQISQISDTLHAWQTFPSGTEGYRSAEVTVGGVDTRTLSSKTMESRLHPGLYFIGEVVDVTGHLGGYNFQWAWSSAYSAAQHAH